METAERRTSIDEVLAAARVGLDRLTSQEAYAESLDGAVLVDVRSEDEQRRQGVFLPERSTTRSRSWCGASIPTFARTTRSFRPTPM
jgi:hypothetical protein